MKPIQGPRTWPQLRDLVAHDIHPASTAGDGGASEATMRRRAEEAAIKFESQFILQMLRQMRSTTRSLAGDSRFLGARENEDMLDLADGMVADALANQRAFGIADLILRQLLPRATAQDGAEFKTPDAAVAFKPRHDEISDPQPSWPPIQP